MRATLVELSEGLVAASVNCWPSVGFDLGAINSKLAALLPAGFYYKTFKWPNWHLYEPSIRRMAGLGRASAQPDPDRYEEVAAEAEVLVIGGGLAGLSAAVSAAEAGAHTLLLASGPTLGGALAWRGDSQVAELAERAARSGVRQMTRTMAFGIYDHNLVCARETLPAVSTRRGVDDTGDAPRGNAGDADRADRAGGVLRERLWKIRARSVIVAAGALERPMIFPDNDRPGRDAGRRRRQVCACLRRRLRPARGHRGQQRFRLWDGGLFAGGRSEHNRIGRSSTAGRYRRRGRARAYPRERRYRQGRRRESRARLHRHIGRCRQPPGTAGLRPDSERGGHAPAVHLHSQAGGKLRWLDASAMFVPDGAAPGVWSAGACAGIFSRDSVVSHAFELGAALARGGIVPAAVAGGAGRSLAATQWPGVTGKQFVDLQNDVSAADVGLAAQENYRSVEHLKRYTTTGMGTDQGKTSNINALVLMGEFTGREPAEVGTTKFRPPFAPVTLGLIAGRRVGALYRPLKHLPAHAWHQARGALFEQFGNWVRPAAYPLAHESLESAAQREAGTVRRAVGLLDGSPLGKIEIYGPDAAQFLDLMYVGTMSTLSLGQARYGLLLNENGIVADDGIVARLGPQHYWVNSTSAGVERTAAAFEEWLQCEYTQLRVLVTPVTSRWGNVTVAGPRAWDWMAAVGFDPELAPGAMKHMTLRESTLDGVPLRVLRASFSGELGYEINVPVDRVEALLERLWERAADFAAVPYGIEALEIMRTEKGYIHIGTDTDGTTLPQDIGFARAMERKAANFVGRRSLLRPASRDPERFQLVALSPADGRTQLPVGAQIAAAPPPAQTEGHVTSSYWSPELRRPVALAMLARGSQRLGEKLRVHHLGSIVDAEVVKAPFVDPNGERLRG